MSVSEGYGRLREWIAAEMTREGVPAAPENIMMTAGSQQGLDFLGKRCCRPATRRSDESPTYLGALQAFSAYEPRYDRLRPEGGNRTPASYAEPRRGAGGAVNALYLVPDFANPTG